MRVIIGTVEEFLQEMATSEPLPDMPVRVTVERSPDSYRLGCYRLSIVATYVAVTGGSHAIVQYVEPCGIHTHPNGTSEEAERARRLLADEIKELGYPVSGGRYE